MATFKKIKPIHNKAGILVRMLNKLKIHPSRLATLRKLFKRIKLKLNNRLNRGPPVYFLTFHLISLCLWTVIISLLFVITKTGSDLFHGLARGFGFVKAYKMKQKSKKKIAKLGFNGQV